MFIFIEKYSELFALRFVILAKEKPSIVLINIAFLFSLFERVWISYLAPELNGGITISLVYSLVPNGGWLSRRLVDRWAELSSLRALYFVKTMWFRYRLIVVLISGSGKQFLTIGNPPS